MELALKEGFVMLSRALLVITVFSAIGKELANPVIKDFLVRKGFLKLYIAIQIAFMVLPHMVEEYASFKSFFKKPFSSFAKIVSDANNWLEELKLQLENNTEPF